MEICHKDIHDFTAAEHERLFISVEWSSGLFYTAHSFKKANNA